MTITVYWLDGISTIFSNCSAFILEDNTLKFITTSGQIKTEIVINFNNIRYYKRV